MDGDFDLSSAQPVTDSGFDLSSAQPVTDAPRYKNNIVKASPVDGNSFAQNALIGSGKFFTDAGLSLRQMYAAATGGDTAALDREAADKRGLDAPVMSTWGGKIGQIGTGILGSIAIPGGATLEGAAAAGGTLAALNPTTANESRADNVIMGTGLGAASQFGGQMLGDGIKAITPGIASGLNGARTAAAAAGAKLGMKLTPGQQTGSEALQQFEAKLQSSPYTSGPFNSLSRNNQNVLNNAGARAIGESGTSLDASVLGDANDRLGDVFNRTRDANRIITANPARTTAQIDAIDNNVQGLLPGNGSIRDNPLVNQLETLTNSGSINGQQLGQLSSKLGKAAYKQMSGPNGDRDLGQALYAVKDHADDLLEQSLTGQEQADYAAARQQYRALMQVTKPVVVNSASGDISGATLANSLQNSDRRGYLYGGNQSDLYNAARFAQAFKPIVGNSGTATRTATNLHDIPLDILGNVASRLYLSEPGQAAARLFANGGNTLGNAAQKALPYATAGLPGLAGTLSAGQAGQEVLYLTQ